MRRLGEPDELNGLAVFLASDASGFMTGSNVMCDVSPPSPLKAADLMATLSLTKGFDAGRILLLLIGWHGRGWDGRFLHGNGFAI